MRAKLAALAIHGHQNVSVSGKDRRHRGDTSSLIVAM